MVSTNEEKTGKYWKYDEEDLKEFTADPWMCEMKWKAEMSFALKVVATRDGFHLVGVGNFDGGYPRLI